MFKIKLEKVVSNNFKGYKAYKIIGWEGGFSLNELPIEYKSDKQMFFAVNNKEIQLYNFPFLKIGARCASDYGNVQELYIGSVYSYDVINEIVGYMQECGSRLAEIRRNIKKIKEEWKGEIEIII